MAPSDLHEPKSDTHEAKFDAHEPKVPSLISILKTTLERLEKNGYELDPRDPAVIELKNSILRAIGEIELKKMERAIA